MAEQESSGLLGLPPAVWIALILSFAGAFALHQKPLQDTRPPSTAGAVADHQADDGQDVEARLWEDPFSAVEITLEATEHPPSSQNQDLKDRIKKYGKNNSKTLLLGVMVTGAPYAEDVEARRRARAAVLAGLYRGGFVPANHDHVGYISTDVEQKDKRRSNHGTVVFEWFIRDSVTGRSSQSDHVLVLWLDQDGFRDQPIRSLSKRLDLIADDTDVITSILGPADSDGLREMHDELERARSGDGWPADLRHMSFYSSRATASDASVLSEASSHNQLAEELHTDTKTVQLLRAVADDQAVASAVLHELQLRGVDKLGEIALVAERDTLYARGMGNYFKGCSDPPRIDPAKPNDSNEGEHVLCFTYLKGLDGFAPATPSSVKAAPPAHAAKSTDSSASDTDAGSTSDASFGQGQLDYLKRLAETIAARRDDDNCVAVESGHSGAEHSARPRSCSSRRIRAIGVISSDVYDKLLILQALHNALPSVTYFTFDLDARLLDERALKWTRQLIVGSSLGLSLRASLQGGIPPFRDTYQTSTYFSTMLALHRFVNPVSANGDAKATVLKTSAAVPNSANARAPFNWTIGPESEPFDSNTLKFGLQWTDKPRIFEVGRTQAFDLTGDDDATQPCDFDHSCPSIAAIQRETLWSQSTSTLKRLLVGAGLAAFFVLAAAVAFGLRATIGKSRTHTIPFFGPHRWNNGAISMASVAIIVTATVLAWSWCVDKITEHGARTPTPLFGGANQWTVSVVDVLTIVTVIVLVLRGQRKLLDNAESMRREFGFQKTSRELIRWHREQLRARRPREHFYTPFWFPIRPLSPRSGILLAGNGVSELEAVIAQYIHRGTAFARLLRVTHATIIAVALLIFLEAIPGAVIFRQFSVIGDHSAHRWSVDMISMLSLFAMQFLILWVADAMLLSRSFLLALLRDKPSWPTAALQQECAKIGLTEERTVLWLNLRLIARRTSRVATMVWYPSFVIVVMTVAALTIQFGDFQFANNPIALLIGTLFVIGAAIALRRSAELWRTRVMHELEDERLREHGGVDDRPASQIDRLLARVAALREGAFAPYSEQPAVRAVLVPALTYGATLVLQYLHVGI